LRVKGAQEYYNFVTYFVTLSITVFEAAVCVKKVEMENLQKRRK